MKEGYITAKWTFSVSDAPETGKLSFLKLLDNEEPPAHHDSTSVVVACETRKVNIIPTTTAIGVGKGGGQEGLKPPPPTSNQGAKPP